MDRRVTLGSSQFGPSRSREPPVVRDILMLRFFMSIQAFSWVFKQKIRPSSLKFVLLTFADIASEKMTCWPSIAYLCRSTSLERKTVIDAVQKLIKLGYLVDSGERAGRTKGIKIYRLNIGLTASSPEIGTAKQSQLGVEAVPFSDRKQSQKRDTEPLRNPYIEPSDGKSDFKKKLLTSGFTSTELNYVSNTEEEVLNGKHIIRCRTKYIADLLDQRCSWKLDRVFKQWTILIASA